MISRVWIDDGCDGCSATDRVGVCFGAERAVLCWKCLADGADVLKEGPHPKASEARHGNTAEQGKEPHPP